jgi:two-component system cell cycle sensor histidine kinase/response regulator CckA
VLKVDKERLFEAIVESASQGILAVDARGTILLANSAAAEMFGYPLDELIGSELSALIPDSVKEAHNADFRHYIAEPTVRPMGIGLDLSARRRDGSEFPVEVSLSFVTLNHGTIGIALVSDITTRKQLDEQIARSQKMDVVGRLAGGIAHDFNNMLTIILGYDRLLLQRMSPLDSLRGYVEEIDRAAERASALTRHLLAFSKHERLRKEPVNLNECIAESMRLLGVALGESVSVVMNLEPELGWVSVDKEQIQHAFANLIINARDAMPHGGQITIETGNVELGREYARSHLGVHPGPYVLLAVTDTGTGMDAETKEHVFEPFFTTKGPDKGTGLGLTTVWATVKNFGGDVWLYTELGKGTTFKIYLPRVTETGTRLAEAPRKPARRACETILLVEDEPGVRKLVAELLESHGYTVLSAADPLQAIQLTEGYHDTIHLLLTDVVMPGLDGFQLAERILELRQDARVLYMSGYSEHAGVLDRKNMNPEHFLEKPFTFEELLTRISALVSG